MFRRRERHPAAPPASKEEVQTSQWSALPDEVRRAHLRLVINDLYGRRGFRDYVDEDVDAFLYMVVLHISILVVELAQLSRNVIRRQKPRLPDPAPVTSQENPLVGFWWRRSDEVRASLEHSLSSSLGTAEIAYRRLVVMERLFEFAQEYLGKNPWDAALEAECETFATAELKTAVKAERGDLLNWIEVDSGPEPGPGGTS
ncbi:MAG TPA: hypothetical protein VNE62_04675 [Actinomycetota bacterium]|nr:hypothetical protein [Actinomycetota bacterium]